MTTLQAPDAQPDEAIEIDNEYSSVYETMHATAYTEREDSKAYNAEELLLEVV